MSVKYRVYTSMEIWQRENSVPSIPTFSQSLDDVVGSNGLSLGSVLELLGLPGTGKTQLCLQLCASIQVPRTLGGLNAEALYVDTNTNFTAHRFKEILDASLAQCQSLLGLPMTMMNEDEALKKLHYVNGFGLENFCAIMHRLPRFIEKHHRIRLIVIDSIVFPFKEGISAKNRTGLLFRLMADLQMLASEKKIAVVVTNEMSTRLGLSDGEIEVGALGDAWAHRCNSRVLLSEGQDERLALLLKSNNAVSSVARFKITQAGIRDID